MQTKFPDFSDIVELSDYCNSIASSMNRLNFLLDYAKRSNDLSKLQFVDLRLGDFVDQLVDKFIVYEKENKLDKDSELDN